MGNKEKGARLERELLHLFWNHKWFCTRVAGSGSMPLPCPDLLAGKNGRVLAVECKSGKRKRRYIEEKQVDELREFAKGFGAEAWIGARFNGASWFFVRVQDLGRSEGSWFVDKDFAGKKGISFFSLIAGK